jgi:hypothetical protein
MAEECFVGSMLAYFEFEMTARWWMVDFRVSPRVVLHSEQARAP